MLEASYLSLARTLEALSPEIMLFLLALFLGYSLVSSVSSSLHAPLMSLTNAISSIIVFPALLGVGAAFHNSATENLSISFFQKSTGMVLLCLLGVNIFGGLLITHRMLCFFQKKTQATTDKALAKILYISLIISLLSLPLTTHPTRLPLFLCIVSVIAFLFSFKSLSSLSGSKRAVPLAALGLLCAGLPFLLPVWHGLVTTAWLWAPLLLAGGIGMLIAKRVLMTALPQLMAVFHSLVGLAAILLSFLIVVQPLLFMKSVHAPTGMQLEILLGAMIGALTCSGSLVAFLKLQGYKGIFFQRIVNGPQMFRLIGTGIICIMSGFFFMMYPCGFFLLPAVLMAACLGIIAVEPIGGADMPIVVSLLNSLSGWAAVSVGFSLNSSLLLIVGTFVGASGWMLSAVMCRGMNRSLSSVLFTGFETTAAASADGTKAHRPVQTLLPGDAAFMIDNSQSIVIIPGYGMAVAQAHIPLREMGDLLKERGIRVRYGVHPVAGRMPGHMNVLLAEAQIPYEDIFDYEDINPDLSNTDIVLVVGANDITNPDAKNPDSPLYGMPVFDVEKAKHVFVLKRSLASGYAGVDNPLFYAPHTFMLFGDAKKVCEGIVKGL